MKKLISVFLALGSFSCMPLLAQPTIQWAKSYGGSGADVPNQVVLTSDGGYITIGSSTSIDGDVTGNHGVNDYWVLKTDDTGGIQWETCLGGPQLDQGFGIQQTADGGYIVVGGTESESGEVTGFIGYEWDYWMVKLSDSGTIVWENCYGGTSFDKATTVTQTLDGGFILTGISWADNVEVTGHHGDTTTSDYWVVRTDDTGALLWETSIGGTRNDLPYSIHATADSGFIIAGSSNSINGDVTDHIGDTLNTDFWIVKINSTGGIVWKKSYGGTLNDVAESIEPTHDGGYIIAGYTNSTDGDVTGNHGGYDFWVVKIDDTGGMQWQTTVGGSGDDLGYSVVQNAFGFLVAGSTLSNDGDVSGNHGSNDYLVVQLSPTGDVLWTECLGGSSVDEAFSIVSTADGGCLVAGESSSTDSEVVGNHGNFDFWQVKLAPWSLGVPAAVTTQNVRLAPNPTSGLVEVVGLTPAQIKVSDLLGREILTSQNTRRFSLAGNPSGMYVVEMYDADGNLLGCGKVVLQ